MITYAAPFVPANPADAPRTAKRLLGTLFIAFGGIAPLVLIIAAFAASPDPAARAGFIVEGLERIVAGLAAISCLGLLYSVGFLAGQRSSSPGAAHRQTESATTPLVA